MVNNDGTATDLSGNTASYVAVRQVVAGQDASIDAVADYDVATADDLGLAVYDHAGAEVALDNADVAISGVPADTTVPGVYPVTVTYTPDAVSRTVNLTIIGTATPVAPTQEPETGVVTIPTTEGVDYQVDGVTVTGEYAVPNDTTVEIVAVPKENYEFADGTTAEDTTYPFDGLTTVTPAEPTRTEDTITIPTTEGVDYEINGEVVTGTVKVPADTTVVVTAVAQDGYDIPGTEDPQWEFIGHVTTAPSQPVIDGNTIIIPETPGIDYQIDGQTVTGVVEIPAGTTVTVTAVAQDGYTLDPSLPSAWEFTATADDVTAEAVAAATGAGVSTGGDASNGLVGLGAALATAGAAAAALRRRKH